MNAKHKNPVVSEVPEVVSIDEAAWTTQEELAVVIDRPQDWVTQDYLNNPPARVLWERPYDSI